VVCKSSATFLPGQSTWRPTSTAAFSASHSPLSPLELHAGGCADRVVDRSAPFSQSLGHWAVKRNTPGDLKRFMLVRDLFHTVVHKSTYQVILLFCVSTTLTHMFFAVIYYFISEDCNMNCNSLLDAFFFSLEIGTTLGLGAKTPYMRQDQDDWGDGKGDDGCPEGVVVILANTLLINILDALLIGLLYSRISRGTNRAVSIHFSEKAVIREINGRLFLMMQVCETRRQHLIEAKVRCYAFLARPSDNFGGPPLLEQRTMRLLHPNDELGAMLVLATPACVVHEIDAWSPLCPDDRGADFPGLVRRSADSDAAAEDCAASIFAPRLSPESISDLSAAHPAEPTKLRPDRRAVQAFVESAWLEVVVLLEGTEPTTSAVIQARHSYTNVDIEFDKNFASLVSQADDGHWEVDLNKLHEIEDVPPLCSPAGVALPPEVWARAQSRA